MEMHKRPEDRSYAATVGDLELVQIFGGHDFQGVTFTAQQMKNLSAFYGFQSDYAKKLADQGHKEAKAFVVSENARIKDEIKKRGYTSFYDPKPLEDPTEEGRQQHEDFLQAGGDRQLMRETRTDGLRLMAYLSHFLQPGEDPVALVHNLCVEAGYDTGSTGFQEDETEGAEDSCDTEDMDPGDMDGDAESALASAGWGTDEDYGGGNNFDD